MCVCVYISPFAARRNWVCVNAGNSGVRTEGENFTITCTTESSNTGQKLLDVYIIHTLPNGTMENITNLSRHQLSSRWFKYQHFKANLSSSDAGEYKCVATQGTDREEDILYLTVIAREYGAH